MGDVRPEDLLRQVVVERMVAGVATRRHVDVTEPVGPVAGKATSRSAVSRRFKAATEAAAAVSPPRAKQSQAMALASAGVLRLLDPSTGSLRGPPNSARLPR